MKAEFCIKFKMNMPEVTNKREMAERVQRFSKHFVYLEDWVTDVDLLNHTITFSD